MTRAGFEPAGPGLGRAPLPIGPPRRTRWGWRSRTSTAEIKARRPAVSRTPTDWSDRRESNSAFPGGEPGGLPMAESALIPSWPSIGRSCQLGLEGHGVDLDGLEPSTSGVPHRRAPDCATSPQSPRSASRTRCLTLPKRAGFRLPRPGSPEITAAAVRGCSGACRHPLMGGCRRSYAIHCVILNVQHRRHAGVSHGWQESNPQRTVLEAAALPD